ncbi:MAG: M16 family metallopeptidase [Pseudobacter sp.]|uniref:M16 family metallopeptidase n=1 Tax=Pseudobacter sp. TaxID=2045420 RepID=UPI003F7F96D6
MKRKLRTLLYGSCLVLVAGFMAGCEEKVTSLPNDSAVRTGVLPNGLTYYIRKNTEPREHAYLMLVNKIGSLVETDEQRGLAHFTEHMAFKGTKNFPQNTLVSELQKMGLRFGADLNAYTAFDQTVYKLDIPLSDTASLNNGLQILRDWAGSVEMENASIDAERGVILEEKRQRAGLQERITQKTFPILLNNARHAVRMPIGTEEVLKNFNHDLLRKFYHDWYRPDLQAIVVVGEFNPDEIERKIKQQFGDLVKPADAPTLPEFSVTLNGQKTFNVVRDEEIKTVSLQLYCKSKANPLLTDKDFRNGIAVELFNEMLRQRMGQLHRQSDPPFVQASAGIGPIGEGLAGPTVQIAFLPGGIERGYTAVITELQRVRKHGFTEGELKLAKTAMGESQNNRYNQREKISSEAYATQYANAFIQKAAYPSEEYINKLVRDQLEKITVSEINKLIDLFFDTPDQDLIIMAPADEKEKLPTEADLKSWKEKVVKGKVEEYKESASASELPKPVSKPGSITATKPIPEIEGTEMTLSNGARVILKPTKFNDDKILINGFSNGGLSLYGQADYDNALFAVPITMQGGVAGMNTQALGKVLTGKMVQFQPFIAEYTEGFSAGSNKKDLETCMKLIHLYFTKTQLDETAVAGMMRNTKLEVEKRYELPANIFVDSVNSFLQGNHWSKQPMTVKRLDAVVPARAVEIYKERFADASGFTFLITGSFEVEEIKPLVEQYLASLPATNTKEEAVDMNVAFASQDKSISMKLDLENKASVQVVVGGTYKGTPWDNVQLNALRSILQYRITEQLRNKDNATYSPAVNIQKSHFPQPRYGFSISFSCDPVKAKTLIGEVKQVIDKLAQEGPSDEEMAKFIAESRAGIAKASASSEFWQTLLLNCLQNGYSISEANSIEKYLGQINKDHLKNAANEFLKKKPFMDFSLMPK